MRKLAVSFFALLLMAAGPVHAEVIQTAVVAGAAADYSSGAHSVVSVDPVGGPRTVRNDLVPTESDISVSAHGSHFYRLGRYQMDHVVKFDIHAPDTPIWQFSVRDEDEDSANPQELVFAGPDKAYLLRYASKKAWIVDPSTTTQAGFKIGELDLSDYDDGDGSPEMHSGVIVNGKLFVTLQRWDRSGGGNWVLNDAWLAVFDTATDTEMETGKGDGKMRGIPLPAQNPQSIQYVAENNAIYVQCAGALFPPVDYTGGIVRINPETYQTTLIIDDGDEADHPYGNISGMVVVSPTKGYFAGYAGWGDNSLYSFNPSTGAVNGTVSDYLKNKNIAGMEAGAYTDKNGMLWVCNSTDSEIVVLNTADDSIDERIPTNLNPLKVVFCEETAPGYHVTPDLWIKAVIKTEEKGDIEAVWKAGGREKTEGGDEVVYGHFYASPDAVNWGSASNPDIFVKIWFDRGGRIDVNFFHVSVPEITVHSAYPHTGTPHKTDTLTIEARYIRHGYE